MKPVVIDSLEHISILGNSGSSSELAVIAGDTPDKSCAAFDALEKLLASLSLDDEAADTLMDIGSNIFSYGEECGFRRGFRVAARLMMECLDGPEGPETGGKAWNRAT